MNIIAPFNNNAVKCALHDKSKHFNLFRLKTAEITYTTDPELDPSVNGPSGKYVRNHRCVCIKAAHTKGQPVEAAAMETKTKMTLG